MERQELIESLEYWIADIQLKVWEAVKNSGVSRKELAERMQLDRSYVDRLMNGDRDIRSIPIMTKMLLAIGKVPIIKIEELKDQK